MWSKWLKRALCVALGVGLGVGVMWLRDRLVPQEHNWHRITVFYNHFLLDNTAERGGINHSLGDMRTEGWELLLDGFPQSYDGYFVFAANIFGNRGITTAEAHGITFAPGEFFRIYHWYDGTFNPFDDIFVRVDRHDARGFVEHILVLGPVRWSDGHSR